MSQSKRARERESESGQSTLEFALTLTLLISFILFFLQLTLLMGISNYIQYATFMAARAYLSSGPTQADQSNRAHSVINMMVKKGANSPGQDRFPTVIKGANGTDDTSVGLSIDPDPFNKSDYSFSWIQGIRYEFQGRVFILPFGTSFSPKSQQNTLSFTSETFLGREPSYSECQQQMPTAPTSGQQGIFDNGC